jgi:hypothetical protein
MSWQWVGRPQVSHWSVLGRHPLAARQVSTIADGGEQQTGHDASAEAWAPPQSTASRTQPAPKH